MLNTPKDIIVRYKKLSKEVSRLRDKYHKEDTSEISDSALDSLKKELEQIEKKYPELKTKNSPSSTVAGGVKQGFSKVRHQVRQWSFNDIFDEEELRDFNKRTKKFLHTDKNIDYFVEEKLDGVKVILTYKKGKLEIASTRGDGVIGEDITENVLKIKSVPVKIKKEIDLIVEGEVFLTIKEFNRINAKRKKKVKFCMLIQEI